MKDKTFTPIVIGYDESAKRRFEANLTAIRTHLKDFFTECEKYVQIEDKNVYKRNLLNSFISDFSDKYQSEFSQLLSIEKMLELSDVPVDKLRFLAAKINEIDVDLDFNTHETSAPDFSIKTGSIEENLLWNYANGISKAIHDNKPNHLTFFNADLVRGFANILQYDFNSQKLVPNVSYIKGQYRRF